MRETEMMKRYEQETGGYAIVTVKVGFAELQFPSEVYVEWLEAELLNASVKAAAYDRLMSINSISENEIKIVLDGNAWCAYRIKDLGDIDGIGALRCPFCRQYPSLDYAEEQFRLLCKDENHLIDVGFHATLEQAIDAWNRRA